MPPRNDNFRLACLSVVMILVGLICIVGSLVALKNGTTVPVGRGTPIQVSSWYTLIFGGFFFGFGVVGACKAYKDKGKYPF